MKDETLRLINNIYEKEARSIISTKEYELLDRAIDFVLSSTTLSTSRNQVKQSN